LKANKGKREKKGICVTDIILSSRLPHSRDKTSNNERENIEPTVTTGERERERKSATNDMQL
jgi:hypothetical protein